MTVQIDLDFDQVKQIVSHLPQREKAELARYLDDQTLFAEVRRVRRELKDSPIMLEEIDAEVKAVRRRCSNRRLPGL